MVLLAFNMFLKIYLRNGKNSFNNNKRKGKRAMFSSWKRCKRCRPAFLASAIACKLGLNLFSTDCPQA